MTAIDHIERRLAAVPASDAELALKTPSDLARAGRNARRYGVLTDPAFLAAKAWRQPDALLADLEAAATADGRLEPFARALRLTASLLRRCERFEDLAGMLWSRLLYDPELVVRQAAATVNPPRSTLVDAARPPDVAPRALRLELQLADVGPWVVALDESGEHVAVGGMGGEVLVWDAAGRLVHQAQPHGARVNGIALSDDAQVLATCDRSGVARLTRLADGRSRRLRHREFVFSPDGEMIAVMAPGDELRVQETISRRVRAALPTEGSEVMRKGRLFMRGTVAAAQRRWTEDPSRMVHAFERRPGTIGAITVSRGPDGAPRVKTWASFWPGPFVSVTTQSCKPEPIVAVPTSPPMRVHLTVDEDDEEGNDPGRAARLRDAQTDELLVDLQDRFHIFSAALSRRGSRLVTASVGDNPPYEQHGWVRLYDAPTLLEERVTLARAETLAVGGVATSSATSAAFVLTLDGRLRRLSLPDQDVQWARKLPLNRGSCVALSPDGTRVAACALSHAVIVCDAATGKRQVGLDTRPGPAHACAFVSSDIVIAALGTGLDPYPFLNGLLMFHVADGETIAHVDDYNDKPLDLCVITSRQLVVTVTENGEVRCLTLPDLSTVWSRLGHSATTCTPIGDDLIAIGGTDGQVSARRVDDGELVWTRHSRSGAISSLDVSPAGALVTGSDAGAVQIWDARGQRGASILTPRPVTVCRWLEREQLVVGTEAGVHLLRATGP